MNKSYIQLTFCVFLFFFTRFIPLFSQQTVVDSLEQILLSTSDSKERVGILLDLSRELIYSDGEKAMTYTKEALLIAQKNQDTTHIIRSYFLLAGNHAISGKLKKGLEILNLNKSLAVDSKDTTNLMKVYDLQSAYHSMLGDLDKAMTATLSQLELAELTGDRKQKGLVFMGLGYYNSDAGNRNFPKAIEFYLKAIEEFKAINDENELAFALLNLGAVYNDLGEHEKCIANAEKSIEIFNRIGDKRYMVNLYSNIASAYYNLNKMELAIKYMRDAVTLFKDFTSPGDLCKSTLALALYLNEMERYDEVLQRLSEIKPLIDELDRIVHYQNYYEELAIAQHAKGQYDAAFKNLELSMHWKDSSYQKIKIKEFEEIQTKFETEKKEQENQLLSQQNDFLESRNRLYTYVGIGLAVIIAILGWLFYQIRKSKRQLEVQNQLIEAQKEQLENLNATKDQFFAIIAHDMRNAVFSFRGISKKVSFLIKTNQLQRLQDISSGIDDAVNNLTNLLNNLLEWALLQKGSIPYDPAPLNVAEVVSEVLDIAQNAAEVKGIELQNQVSPEIKVLADRNALATIIRNLVSNAIKFTESGGSVSVSTKDLEDKTFIEINDTGTGISTQRMEKLFDIDKKKIAKGTAGEKGSGLGLLLVKELVEINKGAIEVFSDLGKGSTFAFSVPRI